MLKACSHVTPLLRLKEQYVCPLYATHLDLVEMTPETLSEAGISAAEDSIRGA